MKMRKGLTPMALLLVGLLVLGGFVIATGKIGGGKLLSAQAPAEAGQGLADCQVEDTTLTLRGYDLENKGQSAGGNHRVYVNGMFTGTVADGGTTTVSPSDEVTVLFGNNTASSDTFYPVKMTEQIGCVGTKTVSAFQKNLNSSAVSISFFNSDDGLINSGTDNQSIGADGEEVLEMTIQATSKDYFGDDFVVVVFDANQNAFDEVSIEGAKKVSTPSQHSSIASSTAYAWEVPAPAGSKRDRYDVVLDAGGTDPTEDHRITVTVYDASYYVNAETNGIEKGVEDEDNNDVGANNGLAYINIDNA